jgi:putative membrane protein
MHKITTLPTVAALSFALAACGGAAERNDSAAADTNLTTVNEVGSVDNMAMGNDTGAMAASAEVKDFAAMLVTDHTKSSTELKAIASKDNITLTPPTLRPDMQSKIDALKAAKGEQFDTLYLSQQVPAHEEALKLHQGYAAGGDNEALKGFASKTSNVVSKHLEEARGMTK